MDGIKSSVNNRIDEKDRNSWNSYLPKIIEATDNVAKKLQLKGEAGYVNPTIIIDSYIFVRFFREDWDLSIVFEKYGYVANHYFFSYIGIYGENIVDSKYLNVGQIFKLKGDPSRQPYGKETEYEYNQKPDDLKKAIENGDFEIYLERRVKEILHQIDECQLPMK